MTVGSCTACDGRYSWTKNGEKLNWNATRISRPDPSVGSIEITDANEQNVGYYQCFVTGKYGVAMSDVAQLVMGVLDEFIGGETVTHYEATRYHKLSLPCKAPRSVPDAEYFWSQQTSSSSTDFIPIQLDSRLQVDQQGHARPASAVCPSYEFCSNFRLVCFNRILYSIV